MTPHETSAPGARRRRPLTLLSLGMATLLLATACAGGEQSDGDHAPSSDASASATASGSASGSEGQGAARAAEGTGRGDAGALEKVTVTEKDGAAPEVAVDGKIEAGEPSTRVLRAGEGQLPVEGDIVKFSTLMVDPATGDVQGENFTTGAQSLPLGAEVKARYPEMFELFTTNGVGSLVAAYSPQQERPAPPAPAASGSASAPASPSTQTLPAQLFVYRVDAVLPRTAQGAEVTDLDERLPKVTVGEDGRPSVAKPEGEAPKDLVVQPLIQGEGAEVGPDDTVTAHYAGVKWSDGSTFDSSWERGTPTPFSLNQVIPGWKEGLAGQKVGSRVLLSIPAEKAYGKEGSPPKIGADEPLLFVVDILDAQAPQAN